MHMQTGLNVFSIGLLPAKPNHTNAVPASCQEVSGVYIKQSSITAPRIRGPERGYLGEHVQRFTPLLSPHTSSHNDNISFQA